jgi:hypothetical protein
MGDGSRPENGRAMSLESSTLSPSAALCPWPIDEKRPDMARLLFTVSEVFTIKSRGIVLGVGPVEQIAALKLGDRLRLRHADGSCCETVIKGIVDDRLAVPPTQGYGILLPAELNAEDVLLGTEVWVCDES